MQHFNVLTTFVLKQISLLCCLYYCLLPCSMSFCKGLTLDGFFGQCLVVKKSVKIRLPVLINLCCHLRGLVGL